MGLITVKFLVLFVIGKLLSGLELGQNFPLRTRSWLRPESSRFVIFSFMTSLGLAQSEYISIGTVVVALSMTVTPLLFIVNEYLIQPRICDGEPEGKAEADEVDEENKVIIAGFGHFRKHGWAIPESERNRGDVPR